MWQVVVALSLAPVAITVGMQLVEQMEPALRELAEEFHEAVEELMEWREYGKSS
jgi:hypothetical protein